jgi:chorismate-pyruvate lyase
MIASDTISVGCTKLKKGHFGSGILQKISELETRLGAKLSTTQKILLAETGTVEQVLSILTGSAVSVKVIRQKEESKHVITRESVIVTKHRGRLLVRAYSKVFPSNLPPKARYLIKQKQTSIGSIIYNLRLETFRKIIEVGYDQRNKLAFRKYYIIHKNKVAFEIKEELLLEEEVDEAVEAKTECDLD